MNIKQLIVSLISPPPPFLYLYRTYYNHFKCIYLAQLSTETECILVGQRAKPPFLRQTRTFHSSKLSLIAKHKLISINQYAA